MADAVEATTKLNEFDKTEWRDVCRSVRPDWNDDQFEQVWADFQDEKRRKQLNG